MELKWIDKANITEFLERLEKLIQGYRSEVPEPPVRLSGEELNDAVAEAAGWQERVTYQKTPHGAHIFCPSKNNYDIAFAWACNPPKKGQLMMDFHSLWIRSKEHWIEKTPAEASRIFIEQHKRAGEK